MNPEPKKIAVLGATGYLGRHVAAHFQAAGHDVAAYDLGSAAGVPGLRFRPLDVTDAAAWER
jgi:nucleoside-diphosphate-sugar epimerase